MGRRRRKCEEEGGDAEAAPGGREWPRPEPWELWAACRVLAGFHGRPRRGGGSADPSWGATDCVVGTVLSQCTTDRVSHRVFKRLRAAFPGGWESVMRAPEAEVAGALREGGQSNMKARFIQGLLRTVFTERGHCSLDYLRDLPAEDARRELLRFPGVGPKTAACVLVYALHLPDFPVDTHVLQLAVGLGWVPPGTSREAAYEHLAARVPPQLCYDLHVLLQEHGKAFGHGASGAVPDLRAAMEQLRREGRDPRAEYLGLPARTVGESVSHVRR